MAPLVVMLVSWLVVHSIVQLFWIVALWWVA